MIKSLCSSAGTGVAQWAREEAALKTLHMHALSTKLLTLANFTADPPRCYTRTELPGQARTRRRLLGPTRTGFLGREPNTDELPDLRYPAPLLTGTNARTTYIVPDKPFHRSGRGLVSTARIVATVQPSKRDQSHRCTLLTSNTATKDPLVFTNMAATILRLTPCIPHSFARTGWSALTYVNYSTGAISSSSHSRGQAVR